MKKFWIIIGVVVVALAIVLFVTQTKKELREIKIGAVLPLTGDAAIYGQWAKEGLDLAAEEINSTGGISGTKVMIIYEDGQCLPDKGVTAIQKLITIDRVPIVIGELCSSVTLAMAPIANQSKTILFSPGSSSPDITSAGDYIFRNWPSDIYEGRSMAEFAYSRLGVKKVAVLYINNDYGVGLKNVFEKRFTELGGSIISTESYEQSSSDFRTQLSKLKTLNAEAIYLPGHTKELGQILKQAKELGIKVQFLSVVGFESPQTLQIAGDAAEGVIYTAPAFDPKSADKLGKQFVTKYRNKYGRDPENFAAHAYDAMNIIALAIKEGGYSSEGIKKSLHKIKNYPGVSGLTTFDENGDVEKPAMLKTVRDGQFIPLSLPGNMKQ